MAVQEEYDPRPSGDPDLVRERFNQIEWIRIPTHCFNRRNCFQVLNHRSVPDITGVQNEPDACPAKEIEHWNQGPATWCRGNMGVPNYSDENGRRYLGSALFNWQ
jgi:hypothetical protein